MGHFQQVLPARPHRISPTSGEPWPGPLNKIELSVSLWGLYLSPGVGAAASSCCPRVLSNPPYFPLNFHQQLKTNANCPWGRGRPKKPSQTCPTLSSPSLLPLLSSSVLPSLLLLFLALSPPPTLLKNKQLQFCALEMKMPLIH